MVVNNRFLGGSWLAINQFHCSAKASPWIYQILLWRSWGGSTRCAGRAGIRIQELSRLSLEIQALGFVQKCRTPFSFEAILLFNFQLLVIQSIFDDSVDFPPFWGCPNMYEAQWSTRNVGSDPRPYAHEAVDNPTIHHHTPMKSPYIVVVG